MPGAPNRPPENAPAAPVTPALSEPPEKKALRRLVPSRLTLLLDIWKGAPSTDLTVPVPTGRRPPTMREITRRRSRRSTSSRSAFTNPGGRAYRLRSDC